MHKRALNILLLSSYTKENSGNMGNNFISAYTEAGHNVTWGYNGIESQIENITQRRNEINKFRKRFRFFYLLISAVQKYLLGRKRFLFFDVKNERKPKLISELDIDKISGEYDLIFIQFTSFMISALTIKKLYDKFHCPIFAGNIDMYHVAGGCMYFGDCRNYRNECRNCPNFTWFNKNQAHKNFQFKKDIYSNIEFAFVCNTWVANIVRESHMFDGANIIKKSFMLDETQYLPKDRMQCLNRMGLQEFSDYFIFLARADKSKRKGFKFIERALEDICVEKGDIKILLLLVGEKIEMRNLEHFIKIHQLGRVNTEALIDAYNVADCFLSPSIDDAGPSMVNQSIACGTPVVSFDIGTALDVVHDGVSGYKAKEITQESFTSCVRKMLCMSPTERESMRQTARKISLKYDSKAASVKIIEEAYYNIIKNRNEDTIPCV